MNTIHHIYITLTDTEYAARLSGFLKRHYSKVIEPSLTAFEKLRQLTEPGVVLLDRDLPEDLKRELEEKEIRFLYMKAQEGLDPFQSAHKIAGGILEFTLQGREEMKEAARVPEETEEGKEREGRILTLYSPCGGLGISSLAMLLSDRLSRMEKKVLYLDLQKISAYDLYFENQEEAPDLSDLIFSHLAEDEKTFEERTRQAFQLQKQGFYTVKAPEYSDLECMSPEEMTLFFRKISKGFDVVIADTGSMTLRKQIQVLSGLGEIYLLSGMEASEREKVRKAAELMPELKDAKEIVRESPEEEAERLKTDIREGKGRNARNKEKEPVLYLPEEEVLMVRSPQGLWFNERSRYFMKTDEWAAALVRATDDR